MNFKMIKINDNKMKLIHINTGIEHDFDYGIFYLEYWRTSRILLTNIRLKIKEMRDKTQSLNYKLGRFGLRCGLVYNTPNNVLITQKLLKNSNKYTRKCKII